MSILHGDCRQQLATLPDASIDAIVTDPPYELGFMGKKWDASGIAYDPEVWSQCLRVLKPGGHLLAFGGTRTYHRMAVAIEDAGFEIRDSIHWLYGSGFPKSLDVSKAIDKASGAKREIIGMSAHKSGIANGTKGHSTVGGTKAEHVAITAPATPAAAAAAGWGTALKPAHEPIVVARKPLVGTVAANVLEHGTGALNINGTRIGTTDRFGGGAKGTSGFAGGYEHDGFTVGPSMGRWPANLVLTHSPECQQTGTRTDTFTVVAGFRDYAQNSTFGARAQVTQKPQSVEVATWECVAGCPVAALNEQSGNRPGGQYLAARGNAVATGFASGQTTAGGPRAMGDSGGASRFFATFEWDPIADTVPFRYVAKPSRRERNAGLDGMPEKRPDTRTAAGMGTFDEKGVAKQQNFHPTVKPVALMRWLVRLVTPPGGIVLDPFLGSGTTAVAAILEGFEWIGCELIDDYLPIIQARVACTEQNRPEPDLTLFTEQP